MNERVIMLNDVVLATTAEFKDMRAEEQSSTFCKFTNTSDLLSGEMLEIMFQNKVYLKLDFSNWADYIHSLPVDMNSRQADYKRKIFKKTLSKTCKSVNSTESNLKQSKSEEIDAIEAEIEETEFTPDLLSPKELQAIKYQCVPRSHHKDIKDATPEEVATMKKRVELSGKKAHWKYHIISEEIFTQYVEKVEQKTADGTKRLNVDQHTLDGLHHVLTQGREIDQEKWLKDKIKEVWIDIVYTSGNKQTRREEEEAEVRRLAKLPCIIEIEGITSLARKVLDFLEDQDIPIKQFRDEFSQQLKFRNAKKEEVEL